jgi:hypothetical protein
MSEIDKKGDFPGHPFRGNQHTGGISHGDKGKLPHRRGVKGPRVNQPKTQTEKPDSGKAAVLNIPNEYSSKVGKVKNSEDATKRADLTFGYSDFEATVHAASIFECTIEMEDGRVVNTIVTEVSKFDIEEGGLIETFLSEVEGVGLDPDGISVRGMIQDSSGNRIGVFERVLAPDHWLVENELFRIDNEWQGTGLGTTILRHWEDQYARAGYDTMVTNAVSGQYSNLNGGYTGAKYGYEPFPEDVDLNLRTYIPGTANSLDRYNEVISAYGVDSSWNDVWTEETNPSTVRAKINNLSTEVSEYGFLPLLAESEDFREYMKRRGDWRGYKRTSPLTEEELMPILESKGLLVKSTASSLLDVCNKWIVEKPEELENDDSGFWSDIRNAYKEILEKRGDFPGHPFRGNQHTGGKYHGDEGKLPHRRTGVEPAKRSRRSVNQQAERVGSGKTLVGRGAPKALQTLALEGGFTWNPKRNEYRQSGVVVAIGKENEKSVSVQEFKDNGERIIREYVQKHAQLLAQPNNHLGACVTVMWRFHDPM